MNDMPAAPSHAKPARRDHLWVLVIIAACCLLEVWASWVLIGSMSGFPRIGGKHGLPTDWTLAVTSEAYWGYALYAWLAGAAGPRSRRFAMWSFAVVFVFSLIGQGASHLAPRGAQPSAAVVVFMTSLPVLVLALIAILIHLRQKDREESAQAEREAVQQRERVATEMAEGDERTVLRAELEALAAEVEPLREALAAAQQKAAQDAAQRAMLERKLAAQTASRKRANPPRAKSANARAKQAQEKDVDARTKALSVLAADPGISGAELGERVGMSKRWGQLHKPELAAMAADLED